MIRFKKIIEITIVLLLVLATVYVANGEGQKGYVNYQWGVNVRQGAGTEFDKILTLALYTNVNIQGTSQDSLGKNWYKVDWGTGMTGFVSSEFITLGEKIDFNSGISIGNSNTNAIGNNVNYENTAPNVPISDGDFEKLMDSEGFPESYKPYLRALHSTHPNWNFKAAKTNINWEDAVSKEDVNGLSVVPASSPVVYKSMRKGSYSFLKDVYISWDSGGWVTGSPQIIKYFMDPRNFLNESGVFQFMTHSFDSNTQNIEGLKTLLKGTFMESNFPEDTYETWADAIFSAGKETGVNPYVLASMILVEQGNKGIGGSISGKVAGYEGIYNFLNIEAFRSGNMDAVTRGLWYGSRQGNYNRPWNSRAKAILGGAMFYYNEYVSRNQNTLYTKKWNVMNGIQSVGNHQYMTNVLGANLEAMNLRRGYVNLMNTPMTFLVPVYENMPKSALPKPLNGNNNYFLKGLFLKGLELAPAFDRYVTEYNITVAKNVSAVEILVEKGDTNQNISGAGVIILKENVTRVPIQVAASSGLIQTYYITVTKADGGQEGEVIIPNVDLINKVESTSVSTKSTLSEVKNVSGKFEVEIEITWTKSAGAKMDGYEIFRSNAKYSGFGKTPYVVVEEAKGNKFLDKSLTEGKTYYYKLRGFRKIDGQVYYSKMSNKVWRTVKVPKVDIEEPKTPNVTDGKDDNKIATGIMNTNISAQSYVVKLKNGRKVIKVIWEKSDGYKVDYFQVFRSDKKASGYGVSPIYTTSDGKKFSYINSKNLEVDKTYYFKVRGVRLIDGKKYYTKQSNKTWQNIAEK